MSKQGYTHVQELLPKIRRMTGKHSERLLSTLAFQSKKIVKKLTVEEKTTKEATYRQHS